MQAENERNTPMSRTGYAKLSNEFWRNTKIRKLAATDNMEAIGLYVLMIAYSSDTLSDGYVNEDAMWFQLEANEDTIDTLCDAGLITKIDDGYQVCSYLKHQNSSEQIKQKRAQDNARVKKNRAKHADSARAMSKGGYIHDGQ